MGTMQSYNGQSYTCTCTGCCTDTIYIDTACGADATCGSYLTSQRSDTKTAFATMMGCTMCQGQTTICFPSDDIATACIGGMMFPDLPSGTTIDSSNVLTCPGGGTSNGGDDPCFPSHATVQRPDGSRVPINELRVGDKVRAVTRQGGVTTDTISLLSLADPDGTSKFYTIITASGRNLTLTAGHHLAVGTECCSDLQPVKNIRAGHAVWMVSQGEGTSAVAERIIIKKSVLGRGLYSPVTTHGHLPLIDDVVTAFDSITGVRVNAALAPTLEPILDMTGTANIFRRTFLGKTRKYIDGFDASA